MTSLRCSVCDRMKCLLIRETFGQIENILFCKHGIKEAGFPMDFCARPYATTRVLPSVYSVTSHHFFSISCSFLPTFSPLPWARLAWQPGERWCQHTGVLTGQWGFAWLAEERGKLVGTAWMGQSCCSLSVGDFQFSHLCLLASVWFSPCL